MGDRRFARRVPKVDMVDVHGQDPAGADLEIRARLFDVSISGAGLIVERPVRVASLVRFECDGRERIASVRHCKRAPEGFMIGVEFEDTLT
jgi:hypothetical protein